MKISNIQLRLKRYRKGSNIKAIVSVVIDDSFIINDIQLIKIADKYHLKFPATKVAEKIGQESVVPINSEIRNTITKAVIEQYQRTRDH
ncbi:septation protein SpoVG family protein [uncultured Ruminococcus sp.]|uniref:septation protein SpoVG family protein n=1 Tax=uncultured Ruminococcus sp. TaxID=165186 RepID=UPI00266ED3AA|nr:septation protein SpoVG family protein [uncultured Ruminococcus sp.]